MRTKVLVVDDKELNREILKECLEDTYEILTAGNGADALDIIEDEMDSLCVILLDLLMPVLDGFGVLKELKRRDLLKKIPVIVISSDNSLDSETKCFDYGVSDFIIKPFNELKIKLRVGNVVDLFAYKNNLEDKVAEQTATLQKQYKKLKQQAEQLAASNQKILDFLGTVVESRNHESGQHINRVKSYTEILANQMMRDCPEYGLDEHIIQVMVGASALHDVGKIAIPDSILLKPGKLTDEEFEIMKTHTIRGCEILDNIEGAWNDEYAKMSYEICRYHHEKYDGKGYPEGLVGDEIPIAAQIVAVADVYDALVNDRVYKAAFPKETAYSMIINGECGQFSPKLMTAFTKVKEKFEKL